MSRKLLISLAGLSRYERESGIQVQLMWLSAHLAPTQLMQAESHTSCTSSLWCQFNQTLCCSMMIWLARLVLKHSLMN